MSTFFCLINSFAQVEIILDTQRLFLYTYNTENRLVKVENGVGGVLAEYYYDPFGRRLWKDVGGARTYFFYSEEGVITEYDASGNELRSYGYQPDSTWTTDPLWLKQDGEYYFYQNDHLGTPQKLVGVNGAVVWSAHYTAFGEADVQVETIVNNLRFPGQYYDEETGLHYNFQRYYEPRSGRYMSADPIGLQGGINLFAYALNHPGNEIDPVGLWVHPHHIIPPDEADRLVNNFTEQFRDNYLAVVEDVDPYWGAYPTELLLAWLGDYVNKPGGGGFEGTYPGFHNHYVFTCQYGWMDMGHFFIAAKWGYRLENKNNPDWIVIPTVTRIGEIAQWLKSHGINKELKILPRRDGTRESVFTPEDLPSNHQGVLFGIALAREEAVYNYGAVATRWHDFLIQSGAVAYREKSDVHRKLREDAVKWWSEYIVPVNPDAEYTGMFDDRYRKHWEQVKYTSDAYWEYCCCDQSRQDRYTCGVLPVRLDLRYGQTSSPASP